MRAAFIPGIAEVPFPGSTRLDPLLPHLQWTEPFGTVKSIPFRCYIVLLLLYWLCGVGSSTCIDHVFFNMMLTADVV
jgi:hypothetical protein